MEKVAEKVIVSIDQGTTGSGVHMISKKGQILASFDKEHKQYYPHPGWVEHDAEEIWENVKAGLKSLTFTNPQNRIEGIGITNQRETIVAWDLETGKPIGPAIVWQCRRTMDYCNQLKKKGLEKKIRTKTGLVVDAYFSASKIHWILAHNPDAKKMLKQKRLAVGTMDSFILWKLTSGDAHATDVTNASRTQLMNIQTGNWDPELLKIFKIPLEILPAIRSCNDVFGATRGVSGIPDGTPISGMIGDQQSALFGQGCFNERMAKCTFGTGSFLLMNTGSKLVRSKSGLLTTIAWRLSDQKKMTYALEGGAFICGAAVQWLRDELKMIHKSAEVEELAKQVSSSEGVDLVPAFVGLGAPHWNSEARAILCGLTRGSNRSHICRATLDAMALQNVDILRAMESDMKQKLKSLRVDGGAVENNLLMQIQADYLGTSVERPKNIESTLMGAAFMAGLGVGFWSSLDEIKAMKEMDRVFDTKMNVKDRNLRLKQWSRAIERTL